MQPSLKVSSFQAKAQGIGAPDLNLIFAGVMYDVLRKILFWFPPEDVHYFSMKSLSAGAGIPGINKLFHSNIFRDKRLQRDLFGLSFPNPVGLGAGFDKNALYLDELQMLGFGFVEIGTVTPRPQAGNDKPRLFRLPRHKALINRMGFNNDGVKTVAQRLRQWKNAGKTDGVPRIITGGNIGKNKDTLNEDAWKDYEICFRELFDCVDYFVVNVSSPNTPNLRELQEKESLNKILSHLQALNERQPSPKPLLLKIAPDLTDSQIDDVVGLSLQVKLAGIVATNTTIDRGGLSGIAKEKIEKFGAGGLSGEPLKERSTAVVRYIHERAGGQLPIIASGGIFNADDANEKFKAGASLVQLWTGFIYEGPGVVKNICEGLI